MKMNNNKKEQEIEELSRNHNTPIKTEIKKEHSDFPSLNGNNRKYKRKKK